MNSSLLTSLSSAQIATAFLCLMAAWGLWKNFRYFSSEEGLVAKNMKAATTLSALIPNIGLILTTLAILFFVSEIWQVSVAAILYSLIQIYRIFSKYNRLNDEMKTLQEATSILAIKLGTMDNTEFGMPLKIWIKRGKDAWPVAELEIGIGHFAAPIERIRPQIVTEYFIPRIQNALQQENINECFYGIKKDLLENGVSHPIDIKGWDTNPTLREMIERIMNANPPEQIHSEQSIIKAA